MTASAISGKTMAVLCQTCALPTRAPDEPATARHTGQRVDNTNVL